MNRLFYVIGVSALAMLTALAAPKEKVTLVRTPDNGIQPQAAVDERGAVHLIYFKGDPMQGDILYVRQLPDSSSFSTPIRVNSQPGSVIAMGTMRGPQMAVGMNGRVHVAWMGSKKAEQAFVDGRSAAPMLYARLEERGTGFEPERNLIERAVGLDGGGTVAADKSGNVYVAWHGYGPIPGEENRAVYVARSRNDGETFEREKQANPARTGACACCGMRAFAAAAGTLHVFYRNAQTKSQRDMTLLTSRDEGKSFELSTLSRWSVNMCPASTASLAGGPGGTIAAWESELQVQFAILDPKSHTTRVLAPPGTGKRKYPSLAQSKDGTILLAWIEDGSWGKAGTIRYQLFDNAGKPVGEPSRVEQSKPWSFATGLAAPNGFVIYY